MLKGTSSIFVSNSSKTTRHRPRPHRQLCLMPRTRTCLRIRSVMERPWLLEEVLGYLERLVELLHAACGFLDHIVPEIILGELLRSFCIMSDSIRARYFSDTSCENSYVRRDCSAVAVKHACRRGAAYLAQHLQSPCTLRPLCGPGEPRLGQCYSMSEPPRLCSCGSLRKPQFALGLYLESHRRVQYPKRRRLRGLARRPVPGLEFC